MDSYIRALRWAADRLKHQGVISFISNSSYIDGTAMDGMRCALELEFDYIYIIDLKGQIRRRSKEQAKIEGGNVFNIMTGVAIIVLVKTGRQESIKGQIRYFNIGDGLSKK